MLSPYPVTPGDGLLGDYSCRAQQFLQLLGLQDIWEPLQPHQEELKLLRGAEGRGEVGLEDAEQDRLEHRL